MVPMSIMLTAAPSQHQPRIDRVALDYVLTAGIVESGTTVGIADSDLWGLATPDGKLDTAAVNRHLDEMQALGVNTVRVVLPWRGNEPFRPGTFPPGVEEAAWARSDFIINAAAERDMAVLAVLAHGPDWAGVDPNIDWSLIGFEEPPQPELFGEYAGRVAARYGEKIAAYEIWNEPNYARAWAPTIDPAAYTAILQAGYDAIKNANGDDPNDPLVVAGVLGAVISSPITLDPATFVEGMYASGAQGYFDALSFHPYHYTLKFSQGVRNDFWRAPLEQLIEIRQLMIDNGDKALKIWATEYGLPTFGDNAVTEEHQAEFIEDFLNAWKNLKDADGTSYAGPSFIYTLRDRLVNGVLTPNTSFGIFNVDWTAKLAAQVIKDFIEENQVPPPDEPDVPGVPNLGEQIAQALQAFFQQIAASVQGLVNSVSAFVNSVAQAIANIFRPAGAAAASLPPDVQNDVAAGADIAAMSWRSGPAAEADADESEGSAAQQVSESETDSVTDSLRVTGEPTTVEETAIEPTEAAVVDEQVPAEEPAAVDQDVATDVDASATELSETETDDVTAEEDSREPVRTGLVARPGQVGPDGPDDTDSDDMDSADSDDTGEPDGTDDDGSSRGGPESGSEAS
ncbi:cellulase family glycosylhydrolase [Mycolicibacterium pulveris]|nr:cellulase family glycosylhydrolase [Mycolicibacterium pulveris]MCV6978957.1 cellulase family glycosylhydrolase [Mycolicibacterium pulveris]